MRAFQPKKGRGLFARLRAAASNRRGVAILMVIAVLAALVALASPFVMSMVLHGRQARNELTSLQARTGAEASIAHATAQLYKTALRTDPLSTDPHVTTPAHLRVSMDFPAAAIQMEQLGVNVQNTSGLLWSAKVEDEQGKINITTAHPALLGNLMGSAILTETANRGATQLIVDDASHFRKTGGLIYLNGEQDAIRYTSVSGNAIQLAQGVAESHLEGGLVYDGRALVILDAKFRGRDSYTPLRSIYEMKEALGTRDSIGPDEFARWERHITVQSGMDSPLWGHGEPQPGNTSDVAVSVENVTVAKGDGFTPGGMVRSVVDGVPSSYSRIGHVNLRNDGSATLRAHPNLTIPGKQPGRSGVQTFVVFQPQFQHPININTASTEVLEAVFMGVCIYGGKEAVTREKAQLLVDTLREGGRVFATKDQLRKAIDEAYNRGILTVAQRDAVFINATEPNSPRLRTSTVPFTFHTYGHLTIEGSGVVNSENGIQLSRNTQRQLLSLPTPWPGHFHIAYQREFQALLDKGLGSRVVTFPTPLPPQRLKRAANNVKLGMDQSGGVRLDVGQSGLHGYQNEFYDSCDDPNEGAYRQDGYDMSKRGPFDLATAPNRAASGGGGYGSSGNNPIVVGRNGIRQGQSNSQNRQTGGLGLVASQPTAVELWYKPIGGGQCVFYDESLEEDRNRITFSYLPGEGLKVEICDAGYECKDSTASFNSLQRKPIQYIYPVELTSGDWHHIGASWKQGGANGIEIHYDAQLVPPRGATIIQRPATKLAGGLSEGDTGPIELEDADDADYPATGAIQIGEEVIEYGQKQGNRLLLIRRGARMSAQVKHDSGALVTPYGFSVRFRKDAFVGKATLPVELPKVTDAQGQHISTTINKPVINPADLPFVLDSETEIAVDDATSFPPTGFIHCDGELIYYPKKSATKFLNVVRGQAARCLFGDEAERIDTQDEVTPVNLQPRARNLRHGRRVVLVSVEVTDIGNYPPQGLVQIDDATDAKKVEWIRYGTLIPANGKNYMVALFDHLQGRALQENRPRRTAADTPATSGEDELRLHGDARLRHRAVFGIGMNQEHSRKTKVIPVFTIDGPQCGTNTSPFGERGVSQLSVLTRGRQDGDFTYVKMAQIWERPRYDITGRLIGWYYNYYAGFHDFMKQHYSVADSRITKWPSGELPDAVNAKRIVGANRDGEGQMRGHVDEVKVNILPSYGGRIAVQTESNSMSADANTVMIEDYNAYPQTRGSGRESFGSSLGSWPTSGLIRIDDELIFYTSMSAGQTGTFYSDLANSRIKGAEGYAKESKSDRDFLRNGQREQFKPHEQTRTGMIRLSGLKRGVLGSEASEHSIGAKVLVMDGMAVAAVNSITRDEIKISRGAGFPREGYVWINNEVISYISGGNTRGGAGSGEASLAGISNFRARYGTREDSHAIGDVAMCLPFRYWDRNPIYEDGEGVAFVQGGYFAQDAVFDSIQLETKGTEEYPKPNAVRPRIIARFNGKPSWGNEPTNKDGGLWEFKNKEGTIPLRTDYGRGVRADQAEVRVYWEYKTGAFIPNSDWKRTFQIEKLGANYKTPMIMRRLDEIERR